MAVLLATERSGECHSGAWVVTNCLEGAIMMLQTGVRSHLRGIISALIDDVEFERSDRC